MKTIAGVVMAPALIIQSMLVAKTARAEQMTEAFTWSTSALLAEVVRSGGKTVLIDTGLGPINMFGFTGGDLLTAHRVIGLAGEMDFAARVIAMC